MSQYARHNPDLPPIYEVIAAEYFKNSPQHFNPRTNPNHATLQEIKRCDDALKRIFYALETLKAKTETETARWADAGNAGKVAQDLEDTADFIAPR